MRRPIMMAAIAGAAAVATLAGAVPAQAAVVAPPAPVTQLSSELAAEVGTGATTTEAVAGLSGTAGAGIALGDAIGVGTLGTAGVVAAGGAWIGTSAGNWLVKILPGDWATTSGSFACDVQWAFNADTACAQGPAPDYIANSDVVVLPAGWLLGDPALAPTRWAIQGSPYRYVNQGAVTAQIGALTPAVGQAGTVDVTLTASGWPTPGNVSLAGSVRLRVVVESGAGCSGLDTSGALVSPTTPVKHYAVVLPAGCTWHVELSDNGTSAGQDMGPVKWYPVGHALRPADVNPNPVRTFVTSWLCMDGTNHSVASAPFTETDPEWPGIPTASCDGSAVSHVSVAEVSTGAGSRTLWTWDAPPEVGAAAAAHPDCVGGGCQLLLERVDAVTGAQLDCFSSSSVCQNWWTETTGATTNTDAYRCTYGGDVVALSECTVYAHAFDPGASTYADPRTGEAPTPAGQPAPQDNTCPPPFSWSALWSQWWAFKATSCALREAFVPSAQLDTGSVTTALNGTAIGQLGAPVGSIGAGLAGLPDGQCGVIIDASPPQFAGQHITVSTCDEPWTSAGPVMKNIIGVGFGLGALIIGIRTLTRTIQVDVPTGPTDGGSA